MSKNSSRNGTVICKSIHIYLCFMAVQKERRNRYFRSKNAPKHDSKFGGK